MLPTHRQYRPEESQYCGTLETAGIDMAYYPQYENTVRRMHSVEVVLLSCILEGRGTHYMGNAAYEERGASIGVVNYGQEHDIVTHGPMKIMNLFLDPNRHPLPPMPGRLQAVIPTILPLHPNLGNRLNRIVHLTIDDPTPFSNLLFAMQRELVEKPYGYEANARLLFASFLILACRAAVENGLSRVTDGDGDPRLERVRGYLDAHYAERIDLERLSAMSGMSRSALCRRFKEHTGKTIFTYLIDRRIESAMIRLRGGTEKVLAVALECGFNDLAFFNRKFAERIGTSPGVYRDRYKD